MADRFNLRRDIQFGTTVSEAIFDEGAGYWRIATDDGARLAATYCIMATGCLSAVNRPEFEGLDRFAGEWYHTGDWPHEGVSFAGKRVGIVGTGSSAIQSIPLIAAESRHLTVFQRQANYTIPARNAPLDAANYAEIRARYGALRQQAKETPTGCWWEVNAAAADEMSAEERVRELETRWQVGGLRMYGVFKDVLVNDAANDIAAGFIRRKIRAEVRDPQVAALLSPQSFVGCKRICLDTDYYATFNRPNVTLVDISDAPVQEITRSGLRTGGTEYALDTIVFAIGFDAMTGPLLRIDIRGRGGRTLTAKWADGPPHLSRPHGRRLPQPIHDHRADQPPRCSRTWFRPSNSTPNGLPTASPTRRRAGSRASRRLLQGRTTGSPITRRWRAGPSSPLATPGTWAPTSTASRAG